MLGFCKYCRQNHSDFDAANYAQELSATFLSKNVAKTFCQKVVKRVVTTLTPGVPFNSA
jgi:hypothetical protein